jgi:hypothetical protein
MPKKAEISKIASLKWSSLAVDSVLTHKLKIFLRISCVIAAFGQAGLPKRFLAPLRKAPTDACLVGLKYPFSMWNLDTAAECITKGENTPDFLLMNSRKRQTVVW